MTTNKTSQPQERHPRPTHVLTGDILGRVSLIGARTATPVPLTITTFVYDDATASIRLFLDDGDPEATPVLALPVPAAGAAPRRGATGR